MSSTLLIGGVRSGKSAWAERYAQPFWRKVFLATAGTVDDDMRERIRNHQARRGEGWQTIETGKHLHQNLASVSAEPGCIVVDCLTVWTALIMNDNPSLYQIVNDHVKPIAECIQTAKADIVIVTNEVGMGVHPEYESGRRYRDLLGMVNQEIAEICDHVILFVAGIPTAVKGSVPNAQQCR